MANKTEASAPLEDPPCWPSGSKTGYCQHHYGDYGHECQRCGYHCNPCMVGWWEESIDYGTYWSTCDMVASWCGRYAEGDGCLPVCDEDKQRFEQDPQMMQREYENIGGLVVFEPYDPLTSERVCWESFRHDDEDWDHWLDEPPVPVELEFVPTSNTTHS